MKRTFAFTVFLLNCIAVSPQKSGLTSPDGKLTAAIEIDNGIHVALLKGRNFILRMGDISLENFYIAERNSDFNVQRTISRSVNEIIKPEIRDRAASLTNSYNELEIRFKGNNAITFRLFNEGLAYRFSKSEKDSIKIITERLDLYFDTGDSLWFQSSETFNSAYETPYENQKVSDIKTGTLLSLPVLVHKSNGVFVMVTESDLYDYPGLWFKGTGKGKVSAINPPYPKSFTDKGSTYVQNQVAGTFDHIARVKGNRTFPWRIFAVANSEKDLISNNMVYLLATPCAVRDISWINPGIVMFDWWAKNNIYGVDFKAGINTATAKYFIDFCAEKGFRYFLFDDGWSESDNLLKTVQGLDMYEVTSYARSKGVDIMLWMVWHTLAKQWNQAFDQFEKWGIKGIKVDFMNRDDQLMVQFYEKVAREAAERKMIVDFHGAYKPCGLNRKYPNVLTSEALIEFEYNGWTNLDNPRHHNLLPYIRMFAGPMDYIPGTMRNSTKDNFRPIGDYPIGQGTRAHSMALFVILSSPIIMLPDSPSDYAREKECTDFLKQIPVQWDDTRLLQGKIGRYTILARRSGREWYIGAITDWNERTLEIKTDFLDAGKYMLEAIEDGINANKRAEDYKKVEKQFQSGDVLKINLASGGGWIAHITPVN